ncbi:hypothetical protein PGT21_017611 [Puccinia graminis f. sp. tritici]|uniref:Uncharacterized protein n=1 Tax=Puccinia graminis f. sp. tritici TaxID=56615 RepID=A0A5B0MXW4_PUCGR|nr:hypothetical protein PGT21_017611 [Puccinia graminis f. sp. tritici]
MSFLAAAAASCKLFSSGLSGLGFVVVHELASAAPALKTPMSPVDAGELGVAGTLRGVLDIQIRF